MNWTPIHFPKKLILFNHHSFQKILIQTVGLFFLTVVCTPSVFAQIQGKVYRDFNANGVFDSTATYKEVGLTGITVTAYNAAGTSVGTTTSNSTGNYTISPVSGAVRVEFTGLKSTDFASAKGTGNETSIQFVTTPTTGVDFGVNYPDDYWNNSTQVNPELMLHCYVYSKRNGLRMTDMEI